jgi:anthranilate synthase component II
MKILVLDNYDSFTYNLVDAYDFIVLSPGPGLPSEAGIMPELIKRYGSSKHIFGVCLGMQAIGEAFGGDLYNLPKVYHGVATPIQIVDSQELIFKNLPRQILVGRYHSWAVVRKTLPTDLMITAEDSEGVIMALSHKRYNVCGVQFHPESIMTDYGKQILRNFFAPVLSREKSNALEYIF